MNTGINVDKTRKKDIIERMTPTNSHAVKINHEISWSTSKVIPLVPWLKPSPNTLSLLYSETSNYKSSPTQTELFAMSIEDIKELINILFELPYTNKISEEILQRTQAIATKTAQADNILHEQLLDIASQLPYLKSTIYTLLDPNFHADFLQDRLQHIAKKTSVQQTETQTLFEILSTSPQRKKEEQNIEIPQSSSLQKNVKAALINATTTQNIWPEENQNEAKETPSLERLQELWNVFTEKLERTQGEYYKEGDTNSYKAIRDILHSKCVAVVPSKNKSYNMVLQTSERAYVWLEESKQGWGILKLLNHNIAMPLWHEYQTEIWLEYRCMLSETNKKKPQNTLPLALHQQSDFLAKEKTSPFLGKIYKDYNVAPIPLIDYKKHLAAYDNIDKRILDNCHKEILRPRNWVPVLSISASHNSQYIFATLNKVIEWYKENRWEKRIARTISAQDLIKLNQLWGQMYRNAIHENKKAPDNPFLKISDFTNYLVITGAEKFLAWEGLGTFSWLFHDRWNCHTILISSHGDVNHLPDTWTDPNKEEHRKKLENMKERGIKPSKQDEEKSFRPDIPMKSAMWFNQVNIPNASEETELGHIAAILQNNLASVLHWQTAPQFSSSFYMGIKKIAQGDFAYLKQIMQLVTQLCWESHDEKEIFTRLYMHCKNKRLFKTPLDITTEEIYQIVAAYTVPYVRSLHINNNDFTIGDVIVKDAVARMMAYIYSPHRETAPFTTQSHKKIVETLLHHGLSYKQSDIKSHRSMYIKNWEKEAFQNLCSLIDQQLINKLLCGNIDTTLSPIQIDPIMNVR
jgi:hypothetical protein